MAKVNKGASTSLEEKLKALDVKYGAGSVILGKDITEKLEVVNSGSLSLDLATNIGGYPIGKLIEFIGMESSGKSTGSLHAIAEFQKIGKCVLIDYEQSFDRVYAEALGVKVDDLIIVQPECSEDGYNIAEDLIRSKEIRLIVIDSHTAGQPKKVVDGDVGDATIGLQARINSQGLGKIKPLLKANRCTVIAISQIRQNIGGYGDINISTGGLAYRFYSDMRIKFAKIQTEKDKESNKTEVNIIKNKCGSPWGKAVFSINWGTGIDRTRELIDFAEELDMIKLGGAGWYTIGETKLQGMDKVKEFLNDNPEFAEELEKQVLTKIKESK